jgi:outer membrane immunogenic protein
MQAICIKTSAGTISFTVTMSAGAVSAADMPIKAALPAVAIYNWTGFYIGINGGGGSAHTCWNETFDGTVGPQPNVSEGCHDATGGTVGGQFGYRWQSTSWVFGVEAQGNWADFQGRNLNQSPVNAPFGFSDQTRIDSFGLFTGQVGYAVNNVLFYAKGGAAVVHDKYNNIGAGVLAPAGVAFSAGNENRWGGVAGLGIEYGFAPGWSVAGEYDHMLMGTNSVTINLLPPFGAGLSGVHNIRQDVDMGTIRLNYRFGGPIVTRYDAQ